MAGRYYRKKLGIILFYKKKKENHFSLNSREHELIIVYDQEKLRSISEIIIMMEYWRLFKDMIMGLVM